MDVFDDSQDPFAGLQPLALPIDPGQSDSEDEIGLNSLADHDNYSHMNIPESMKNILRMNPDGKDLESTQDDSESDNDSIYKTPSVNIERLNADISKNKFLNFPLMPQTENDEPEAKKKKTKKPKEKKKRRDKGKKHVDMMDEDEESRKKNLDNLLAKFAGEHDSEDDTPKKKKSKGRKTRKTDMSMIDKVDENGERLVRTTEFLDTDTENSSEDERALSKKQELEMYKESERLRRAANARLKLAYNVIPYDNFVTIQNERESTISNQLETPTQQVAQLPSNQHRQDDSSDDDLLIINNPMTAMMSPDRVRSPMSSWSPVKHANKALRSHNKSMLSRITNEGFAYRLKMEQEAKARGQFSSATERAKRLLEKEKNAMMINDQIKMHFERTKKNEHEDEVDEDYQDSNDDEKENDLLDQLSGQDEDEEEETSAKRKIDDQESEEDEEGDDMGPMAMNRWMSKKAKKSIFDDSDDDEEEVRKQKKVTATPAPAHSISNFFKAKEDAIAIEAEPIEEKSLTRLKRRTIKENVADEDEDMDMDEPTVTPKVHKLRREHELTGLKEKSEYFEEEAEEEEDEFFGHGGEDIDNGENLDEFEEDDLLVHENDEHIDEAALRDAYNKQDAESDSNMIQRLLKDVTGGGLRKQKAAAEAGLVLEDIDLYDEEDNDLIAIRLAAAARRRKLLKKKGADPLDNLMNDPKTVAFAKAFQAIPDEAVTVFLSDSEGEAEEEQIVASDSVRPKLVIKEDDDEEEDKDDLMDVSSDEDDLVVADEFNPMSSPLRGGLVNNMTITSADDNDEEFQVETMKSIHSPLNSRRTKSMFNSPVSLNRFKRLMSETNNNTSDTPRAGFGPSAAPKSSNPEEDDIPKTFGSIGGFLKQGGEGPKKSRLGLLLKKPDVFKYTEQ